MNERIVFAGVEFNARDRGDDNYTVRTDTFRKILKSGKVHCILNFHHDDQGELGDQNRTPTPEELLERLDEFKPNVLYYCRKNNEIRFSPHRNLSYRVRQKPVRKPMTLEERDALLTETLGPIGRVAMDRLGELGPGGENDKLVKWEFEEDRPEFKIRIICEYK